MAGIEKVCEYSGEYPGGLMYGYKRNHIQVIPKYRKEFRGKKATLHVFKNGLKEVYKCGARSDAELKCINPNPTEENWDNHEYYRMGKRTPWGKPEVYGVFFENIKEYKNALKQYHQRLLMEYAYILEVPEVQGEVNGLYSNYSTDLTSVKRRMRRLVGRKNLTIIYHDCTMYEFYESLGY